MPGHRQQQGMKVTCLLELTLSLRANVCRAVAASGHDRLLCIFRPVPGMASAEIDCIQLRQFLAVRCGLCDSHTRTSKRTGGMFIQTPWKLLDSSLRGQMPH
jgi:hypothetical protein